MQIVDKNIIGCFISSNIGDKDGAIFRNYLWGDGGIAEILKTLTYEKYGSDITMILLKFYVNPIPYLKNNLKEIENYRRTEKSLAVSIVINESFFLQRESDRKKIITDLIIEKIELLKDVILKKKLDTNIEMLKSDVIEIFRKRMKDLTKQ